MDGYTDPKPVNAGANPPNGVVFNYWLKDAGDSSIVSITVFDKKGESIKTFSKDAKEKVDQLSFSNGMNRFVWDMLYPRAVNIDGLILWNGTPEGPKVAPGNYKARFRYGNDSADASFTIKGDPNYAMTEAGYDAQVAFLLQPHS